MATALPLDAVLARYDGDAGAPSSPGWLRIPIGLRDRPREQLQTPLALDFTGTGGHLAVIGAPRSGKSMLLQSLVASLVLTHDPGDVQVYAIDLGGGGLHRFRDAPHVGAVLGPGEPEEVSRLVRELRAIADERASIFRRHGLDGMTAYHAARRAGELPGASHGEVFLVVDNWAAFAQDFQELEGELVELAASGLHYGVHLVVASSRWNDLRLALRDNVGGRVELRLNDPIESELDRHAAKALPADTPGRGLVRGGEQFHAALPRIDGQADIGGLGLAVDGLLAEARRRWAGSPPAPRLRMLPPVVHPSDLPDPVSDEEPGVAIGLEEFELKPLHIDLFDGDPHFVVLGDAECGKTALLRGWMRRLAARYEPEDAQVAVVDYRRQLLGDVDEAHLFGYACTPEMTAELAGRLAAELSARLPSPDLTPADLRRRRWWSGPELVLFVDDYDLVASPNGNPLAALSELLAHGRDIGFHVVLARRVGGMARSAFEPFLQRIGELGTPGLVMSGDPQEGPLIGGQKAEPLPPGRGYLVRRRRSALVHTIFVPGAETVDPGVFVRAGAELGVQGR